MPGQPEGLMSSTHVFNVVGMIGEQEARNALAVRGKTMSSGSSLKPRWRYGSSCAPCSCAGTGLAREECTRALIFTPPNVGSTHHLNPTVQ